MIGKSLLSAAVLLGMSAASVNAANSYGVYITEWQYNDGPGEFIELTNTGSAPVDFSGWSYDDDSRSPGVTNLSAFGVVAPRETVILTEADAEAFRSAWELPASIKIIGNYTNNLGRADEINIFDGASALVDRLTYGDQAFPGTLRTNYNTGVPATLAALGANDVYQWIAPVDAPNNYGGIYDLRSVYPDELLGDIGVLWRGGIRGNPGYFYTPVPEPTALSLLAVGAMALVRRRRA